MPPQSKRWCFTINNPGDFRPNWRVEEMKYMVWQREVGENGTPHIQGYVRFVNKKRLNGVKQAIGCNEAHLECANGSEEENRGYCTKEESRMAGTQPTEHGEYNAEEGKQGKRSDLEAIAAMCKAGASLAEIADAHPGDMIRYHSGIAATRELLAPKPPVQREVQVLVLWGPTGTGKTHRVLTDESLQGKIFKCKAGRDPFGQYNNEEVLFLEEFRWQDWTIQTLNDLLDKWICPLDCRYRNKYAYWTKVIICSNDNPTSWFITEPNQALVDSLRRRIGNGSYLVDRQGVPLEELQQTPKFLSESPPASPTQLQTQD